MKSHFDNGNMKRVTFKEHFKDDPSVADCTAQSGLFMLFWILLCWQWVPKQDLNDLKENLKFLSYFNTNSTKFNAAETIQVFMF